MALGSWITDPPHTLAISFGPLASRAREKPMARQTLLQRIVDERVGQTIVAAVSIAVDKVAEEIAREALSDETFRRAIREIVRRRSEELLDTLLRNGTRAKKSAARGSRRRTR